MKWTFFKKKNKKDIFKWTFEHSIPLAQWKISIRTFFDETYIDKFAKPLIIQRTAKKQLTSDWSNMSNGRIENDTGLEQQVMCQGKMREKNLCHSEFQSSLISKQVWKCYLGNRAVGRHAVFIVFKRSLTDISLIALKCDFDLFSVVLLHFFSIHLLCVCRSLPQ